MQRRRAIRQLDRQEWAALTPLFRDMSYRQGGAYAAAAAAQVGAVAEYIAFYREQTLVGLGSVRVKRVPFLPLGMAYVNYGPLTMRDDTFSPASFAYCLDLLQQEYVDRRGLLLRVAAPQGGAHHNDSHAVCLKAQGLKPMGGQTRLETYILDLDQSLAAIRGRFDRKWHASLCKAEKSGLEITRSIDPADFARFQILYDGLVERKGFFAKQGAAFFAEVIRHADPCDQLVAHLAWFKGELVAGHIGSFAGDTALMILGAANETGRDLLASFLLQWVVVQHARAVGNLYYDLGGVDPVANPDVHRFKKRLNGRHVISNGSFEIAPSRTKKRALETLESGWSYLQRTRRRFGGAKARRGAYVS